MSPAPSHTGDAVPAAAGPPVLGVRSLPVLLLAAVALAVGSTEFIAVGSVPEIGRSLGVSSDAAGLVVSLYAAGVAVCAIPTAILLGHHPPRRLLPLLLVAFVVAHVVMAAAPTLGVLVAGRVLAAATQGLALGIALHAASVLVRPEDRGAAVAMVFGGLLTAMFLAAPLGTVLGEVAGWRVSFVVVGAFALVLAAAVRTVVPEVPAPPALRWDGLRDLARPGVAGPVAVCGTQLLAGSVLFAYLGVYLEDVLGLGGSGVAIGLALFGFAGLVGNALSPAIARRAPRHGTALLLTVTTAAIAVVGIVGDRPVLALLGVGIWGASQMAMQPALTDRAVGAGGAFAGTLNVAVVNAGIALGGLLGGAVVGADAVRSLPWVAAGLTLLVLVAVVAVTRWAAGPQRAPATTVQAR